MFFPRAWYGYLTFSSLVHPFVVFVLVDPALPARRSFLQSIGPVPRAGAWNVDFGKDRSPGSFSSVPSLLVPSTCRLPSEASTCFFPARLHGPIRLSTWSRTRFKATRAQRNRRVVSCRTHAPPHVDVCFAFRAARTASTSLFRLLGRAVPRLLRFLLHVHVHVHQSTSCSALRRALLRSSSNTDRIRREFLLRRGGEVRNGGGGRGNGPPRGRR